MYTTVMCASFLGTENSFMLEYPWRFSKDKGKSPNAWIYFLPSSTQLRNMVMTCESEERAKNEKKELSKARIESFFGNYCGGRGFSLCWFRVTMSMSLNTRKFLPDLEAAINAFELLIHYYCSSYSGTFIPRCRIFSCWHFTKAQQPYL